MPNSSKENKAKNRRVMFVVEKYDFKLYKGTNVKAKTGERVGHIGRGEALGCQVSVLIEKRT